jgi:hypothetical protein
VQADQLAGLAFDHLEDAAGGGVEAVGAFEENRGVGVIAGGTEARDFARFERAGGEGRGR